jgi:hypothetical protein
MRYSVKKAVRTIVVGAVGLFLFGVVSTPIAELPDVGLSEASMILIVAAAELAYRELREPNVVLQSPALRRLDGPGKGNA